MDRAEGTDGGGAVGEYQIEIPRGDFGGIGGVGEAHLFGEGIGVEPVDQPFAPACDHRRLREMRMGVDESCGDQPVAVIPHRGTRVPRAQLIRRAGFLDQAVAQRNAAVAHMNG